MNHLFHILSLLILLAITSRAQQTCGSTLDLRTMKTQDSERYQRFADFENFTRNFIKQKNISTRSHGGLHIVIPVIVHVLHDGEAVGMGLNISMAQIQSRIDVLNEDYRRLNSDASNTPSEFQGY